MPPKHPVTADLAHQQQSPTLRQSTEQLRQRASAVSHRVAKVQQGHPRGGEHQNPLQPPAGSISSIRTRGHHTPLPPKHSEGKWAGGKWPSHGCPGPRCCPGRDAFLYGWWGKEGVLHSLTPLQPPCGAGVMDACAPSCCPSATLPAQTPCPFHSVGVLICWQQWAG